MSGGPSVNFGGVVLLMAVTRGGAGVQLSAAIASFTASIKTSLGCYMQTFS